MMVWVQFLLTSAVIVYAALQLAKYGDVIAIRTRLGGVFIGTLLLAGITSLPEFLTIISALGESTPDLAVGNLLGSNMFNMLLLAIIDVIHSKHRLLRKAAFKHALSGSLTIFIIALVVFFIVADIELQIGWVGVDSLILIGVYVSAIWLLQPNSSAIAHPADSPTELPEGIFTLRKALIGFGLAAAALIVATPLMVNSSVRIAEITGVGTTFIGITLVATVTSLPEMFTTIAAVRYGADDMAIGNLFGSNLFNMAMLGLTDFFFLQGRFLGTVNPDFVLIGLLGIIMTGMALIGNLARLDRRILFVEIDSLLLILAYFSGLWFLYRRGVVP